VREATGGTQANDGCRDAAAVLAGKLLRVLADALLVPLIRCVPLNATDTLPS
jgi:hypothetical protein